MGHDGRHRMAAKATLLPERTSDLLPSVTWAFNLSRQSMCLLQNPAGELMRGRSSSVFESFIVISESAVAGSFKILPLCGSPINSRMRCVQAVMKAPRRGSLWSLEWCISLKALGPVHQSLRPWQRVAATIAAARRLHQGRAASCVADVLWMVCICVSLTQRK